MKIVHVITSLGLGGAEKIVCDIADQQASNGNDVFLVSITGDIITKPSCKDIKLIKLKCKKTPIGYLNSLIELRRLICALQPDVVHGHMYHAIMAVRLTTGKKIAVINSFHNLIEVSILRNFILKITSSFCDVVTCVSPEAAKNYGGRIIPNGINIEKFQYSDAGRDNVRRENKIDHITFVYGYVGRLHKDKNIKLLIDVFSKVRNEISDSKLMIVGDGVEKENLINYVKILNLSDSVIFIGRSDNVAEIYSAIDLLVVPSLKEGFGLVAAESILCRTPVISMNNSGVPFVLNKNELICLSDVELKNKMMMFFHNQISVDVEEVALSVISRFNIKFISNEYEKIYQCSLMDKNG